MKSTLSATGLAIFCVLFSLSSCSNPGAKSAGAFGEQGEVMGMTEETAPPAETRPVSGFLVSGYQPLEDWMDARFKVRYENMPLQMVFDQAPISDIRYKLVNLPEDAPVFHLVSDSISRREILREISDYFDLRMEVQMIDGQPGYVVVRGPGGAVSSAEPVPGGEI